MKDSTIYAIRAFLILLSILVPAVMGIISFRRISGPMRILIIYVTFCFVVECLAVFAAYRFKNNLLIYDIAGPIEMAFTGLYFGKTISYLNKRKLAIPIAVILFIFGNGINLMTYYAENQIGDMMSVFGCATICLAMLQCWDLLMNEGFKPWKTDSRFWVSMIFIFFYVFTFFLFSVIDHFQGQQEYSKANIFFYILTTIILACNFAFVYVFRLHVKKDEHVR